ERQGLLAPIQAGTLDPAGILTIMAPREATDASVVRWWRMFFQSGVSPAPADIRQLLGSVQAPVLVLHRTGDRYADVHAARYLTERLPTARLAELPGDDSSRSTAIRMPWSR